MQEEQWRQQHIHSNTCRGFLIEKLQIRHDTVSNRVSETWCWDKVQSD